MKRQLALVLCCVVVLTMVVGNSPKAEVVSLTEERVGRRQIFNEGWKFSLNLDEGMTPWKSTYDDSDWQRIRLPHDWSIYFDFNQQSPAQNEGGLLDGGIGWYRKTFVLPDNYEGKTIRLRFGGVYMDSTIYVNGNRVGHYPSGYTSFSYDISDYLTYGPSAKNVIAVKVVNRQPSSRWYSGSGIYRDVELIVTEPIHIPLYGTYITTPHLKDELADNQPITTQVVTKIENQTSEMKTVKVVYQIEDESGQPVSDEEIYQIDHLAGQSTIEQQAILTVTEPRLWSVNQPALYYLTTKLLMDNQVVDQTTTRFGYRYIEWHPEEGFFLNNQYLKLHGVCMHHDQGALGAIANESAMRRQMTIMKEMGVNAIRSTHNQADDKLVAICEEMGLLLVDEAFDTWYQGKKRYDYGRFFEKTAQHPDAEPNQTWAEFDLKEMVNRDKNSPAVIMYSLGNEIWEANGDLKSVQTVKQLSDWVKEVDDTRYVTMGQDQMRDHQNNKLKISAELGAVGLNYAEEQWQTYHQEHPEWLIYGSETSSATRSRGIYYDSNRDSIKHDDSQARHYQQSDFGNDNVNWGRTAVSSWRIDRDHKGYAGQFIWTGFDYIGEPTPWHNQQAKGVPSKSSYFGIVDTAGFPKNDYYLYQSQWRALDDHPVLHILPHWNWSEEERQKMKGQGTDLRRNDQKIPVRIFSNAPKVELFLNNQSLGIKAFNQKQTVDGRFYQEGDRPEELYLEWLVDYEPGTIRAVALDTNDQVIIEKSVTTAGKAAQVKLYPEKRVISADGKDLAYIPFVIEDEQGQMVPYADNQVFFELTGQGRIVGVDNGNAASQERYQAQSDGTWHREAFSGKGLVIVQANNQTGKINLLAKSSGLMSDSVSLYSTDGDTEQILGYEIPVLTVRQGATNLELPMMVKAIMGNGQTQEVKVDWADYNQADLETVGSFTIDGLVAGQPVQIKIIVKGVQGYKPMTILTKAGYLPELPSMAELIYSDGMIEQAAVIWEERPVSDYVTTGITVVVDGYLPDLDNMPVKVQVQVVEATDGGQNIAISQGLYPKAEASFEANDKVLYINDGDISFGRRWTNWVSGGYANQETDWVQLIFEHPVSFDKIGVHFFTDGQTKEPVELVVSTTTDGQTFVPVSNQSQVSEFGVSQGDVGTEYPIYFEQVTATGIRLSMTGQPRQEQFKPVGLVELKVYTPEVEKPSNNADLSDIRLNGVSLDEFKRNQYTYVKRLDYGQPLPVVTTDQEAGIQVTLIPATEANNYNAKIFTLSADGSQEKIYSIKFVYGQPQLNDFQLEWHNDSHPTEKGIRVDDILSPILTVRTEDGQVVEATDYEVGYEALTNHLRISDGRLYVLRQGQAMIRVEVTYQGQKLEKQVVLLIDESSDAKKIIGFEPVTVRTQRGQRPVLPVQIVAHYDKGGLDKPVTVEWEPVSSEDYLEYGHFFVYGKVEGTNLYAKAKVEVEGYLVAEAVRQVTLVGERPFLPEQVKVYHSNGETQELVVEWQLTDAMFNQVGTVEVEGLIEGINHFKAKAVVRVTDQIGTEQIISKQVNGFDIPAAIASFTNDGPGSSDRVSLVNDGIIDYDNSNPNRWTNWQPTKRSTDWVGILFGEGGNLVQPYIDNLAVAFFEDHGTKLPADYEIEYFVPNQAPDRVLESYPHIADLQDNALAKEENWQPVPNLQKVMLETARENQLTFDKIKTYAIRIKMVAQPSYGLGITEMKVKAAKAVLQSDYELVIRLDGQPLDDFVVDQSDYHIVIESDWPVVTADMTNNGAVTIIPATEANGWQATVVAEAEDGTNQKVYRLIFDRGEPQAEKLHFIKQPKQIYQQGETLLLEEESVEVIDSNGQSQLLSMTDSEVTISGYDSERVGQQVLKLTYRQLSLTWQVTVQAKLVDPTPDPVPDLESTPMPKPAITPKKKDQVSLSKEQSTKLSLYEEQVTNPADRKLVKQFMTGEINLKTIEKELTVAGKRALIAVAKETYEDSIADWCQQELALLTIKDYVKGYPDKTFGGRKPISGQEYLTLLVRIADWQLPIQPTGSHWFSGYAQTLSDRKLLNGVDFPLDKDLTRQEVAYLTDRWLRKMEDEQKIEKTDDKKKVTPTLKDLDDSRVEYRQAIINAERQAVFIGDDKNNFRPNDGITREEGIMVIYRLLLKKND